MSEKNSKFPKFFIYMFSALIIVMIICCFFSSTAVANVYFAMLLVVAVFILLDKKYGFFITNYKSIFIMFDISSLIASFVVIFYEHASNSLTVLVLLYVLMGLTLAIVLTDILLIKNKLLTKKECLMVEFMQLCLMICMLTYFYKVSSFWYLVVAVAFEAITETLKIYFAIKLKNRAVESSQDEESEVNDTVEKIERAENEDEGDME